MAGEKAVVMVDMEMKVVLLMLAFVGALYGLALVADGGPTYRDNPSGLLTPVNDMALGSDSARG
jgi:hypothetical protein